jgi:hypothetical protein
VAGDPKCAVGLQDGHLELGAAAVAMLTQDNLSHG